MNAKSSSGQPVALYGSTAAGIYLLYKAVGWLLLGLVVLFVAIPRMFAGGHFGTDVLVDCILGSIGDWIARRRLEARVTLRIERLLDQTPRLQLLRESVVFFWITQVAVEFQRAVWVKRLVETLIR